MLGTESLNNNHTTINSKSSSSNNITNNHNNNNNVTQVSCTTTTLIKYKVNKGSKNNLNSNNNINNSNNSFINDGHDTNVSSKNEGKSTTLINELGTTTTSSSFPITYTTTKTTTKTTFNINNNNKNVNHQSQQQQHQHQHRTQQQESCDNNNANNMSRPPFITTVKKGKFLPSKFDLLIEKSLFTFSSRPRPVNLIKKHHCCSSPSYSGSFNSSFTKKGESSGPTSTTPPRGAHDYYNVMWDPHVIRGSTASTTRVTENHKETKSGSGGISESSPIESKISKTKRSNNNTSSSTSFKSKTNKSSSKYKSYSLSPSSPLPIKGRHHTMIQTEQYLEELPDDRNEPITIHQSVQTEPLYDVQLFNHDLENNSLKNTSQLVQVKNGVDNSTQILPGELFYFDEEVQPILESMIGKILEQAMFETIEEEEIAALREEKNRFQEQRRRDEKELLELQLEHEKINAQKEQLKRGLLMDENQQSNMTDSTNTNNSFYNNSRTSSTNDYYKFSSSTARESLSGSLSRNMRAGTSVYTTSYLLELLPSVLNSLRQEGFISDNFEEDAFSAFVPHMDDSSPSSVRSGTRRESLSGFKEDEEEEETDEKRGGKAHEINSIDETHVEEINYDKNEDVVIEKTQEIIIEEEDDEGDKWPRCSSENNNEKDMEELSSSPSWSPTTTTITSTTQDSLSYENSTTTTTTVTTIIQQHQQPSNPED